MLLGLAALLTGLFHVTRRLRRCSSGSDRAASAGQRGYEVVAGRRGDVYSRTRSAITTSAAGPMTWSIPPAACCSWLTATSPAALPAGPGRSSAIFRPRSPRRRASFCLAIRCKSPSFMRTSKRRSTLRSPGHRGGRIVDDHARNQIGVPTRPLVYPVSGMGSRPPRRRPRPHPIQPALSGNGLRGGVTGGAGLGQALERWAFWPATARPKVSHFADRLHRPCAERLAIAGPGDACFFSGRETMPAPTLDPIAALLCRCHWSRAVPCNCGS